MPTNPPTPPGPSASPLPWLFAALQAAILIPILLSLNNYYYFRTFRLDAFDGYFTLFIVLLCLLIALAFFFTDRPDFHASVKPSTSPLEILGGLWLPVCAFSPFFGWIITSGAIPITHATWHILYALRAILCILLPLLCALPLLRYIRGKAALIQIPLLLIITTLPLLAGLNYARDLVSGPTESPTTHTPNTYLPHTAVTFANNP
ncbi:MAG TPA: hypothetical protein VHQ47_15130 [Phycisphaerae bacterium]|nr:hypothetical protein [Phycisphaerae bacterium]